MEELIQADGRMMIDSVAAALGRSHGLKFQKVRTVSGQRTEGLNKNELNGFVLAI
jgi:hypothetical protein